MLLNYIEFVLIKQYKQIDDWHCQELSWTEKENRATGVGIVHSNNKPKIKI